MWPLLVTFLVFGILIFLAIIKVDVELHRRLSIEISTLPSLRRHISVINTDRTEFKRNLTSLKNTEIESNVSNENVTEIRRTHRNVAVSSLIKPPHLIPMLFYHHYYRHILPSDLPLTRGPRILFILQALSTRNWILNLQVSTVGPGNLIQKLQDIYIYIYIYIYSYIHEIVNARGWT